MKQIIIATNDRERIERQLSGRDLHVTWCPMTIEGIQEVRDRSNLMFLVAKDEDEDELKRIGLYLRDLCIEYEKILYIYGNRRSVDILRARIPALYVRKSGYTIKEPFSLLLDDVAAMEQDESVDLPALLILDDKTEFIEKLRLYLEPYFRIYVSHYDPQELGILVLRSNVVLMGTDRLMTVIQFMELSRMIGRRREVPDFHLYFLAKTQEERAMFNSEAARYGIAFSADMDASRVADYLIRANAHTIIPDHEDELINFS